MDAKNFEIWKRNPVYLFLVRRALLLADQHFLQNRFARKHLILTKEVHLNGIKRDRNLEVSFFKKIHDWILKSERTRRQILRFFT